MGGTKNIMEKERLKNILEGKEKYNVLHITKKGLNGCTYYRNMTPLVYLQTAKKITGHIESSITTTEGTHKETGDKIQALDATLINWADIVVFSRYYNPEFMKLVDAYSMATKDMGKVMLYETDDDFFNIPEHNGVYREASDALPLVKTLMERADGYTTTTKRLGKLLTDYSDKPVFILPNSLELDLFEGAEFKERPRTNKIRIGWAGGNTHALDLVQIIPAMVQIQKKYPHVEFVGLGSAGLRDLFTTIPSFKVEWHEFTKNVMDYPMKLVELDLDIGLIPLENYEFNFNKSAVKWEEYSAAKMATIYAKIPPYSDAIVDGVTGLGVTDPSSNQEWFDAIVKLVNDVELRVRLARNAHEEIIKNYDMSKNYLLWDRAYKYFLEEVYK